MITEGDCTCGAVRPRDVFIYGPHPGQKWWCICGKRWHLLSAAEMESIALSKPMTGHWICSDDVQVRVLTEIHRQMRLPKEDDFWERYKGLIA